jgi:hypothetical protein
MKNASQRLRALCPSDNRQPILILGQYAGLAAGERPGRRRRPSGLLGPMESAMAVDGRICLRPDFKRHLCDTCHRIFPEDVKRLPLDDRAIINAKPGRYESTDNVLLFHESYRAICERLNVKGLEYRQIGTMPWYAVFCNHMVPFKPEYATLLDSNECKKCGRTIYRFSERTRGLKLFDHVELGGLENTVFTMAIHNWCELGGEPWQYITTNGHFIFNELGQAIEKEAKKLKLFTAGLVDYGMVTIS